jgi:hypothetical protein
MKQYVLNKQKHWSNICHNYIQQNFPQIAKSLTKLTLYILIFDITLFCYFHARYIRFLTEFTNVYQVIFYSLQLLTSFKLPCKIYCAFICEQRTTSNKSNTFKLAFNKTTCKPAFKIVLQTDFKATNIHTKHTKRTAFTFQVHFF